jgi:hypothetical protein
MRIRQREKTDHRVNPGDAGGKWLENGEARRVQNVKKPADEESSGHRFVAWVIRHADWPCGRDLQPVAKTG